MNSLGNLLADLPVQKTTDRTPFFRHPTITTNPTNPQKTFFDLFANIDFFVFDQQITPETSMPTRHSFQKIIFLLCLVLGVSACGGGGGDGAGPSQNANLTSVTLSSGSVSPAFDVDVTSYTASVPPGVSSITVDAGQQDTGTSITINGTELTTGGLSIDLTVGENTIEIIATAAGGATKTYIVIVTRPASTDADLGSLIISSGALSPTFSAAQLTYTATALFATTALTVTPTVSDSNATVTVNGVVTTSGSASQSIAFSGAQSIVSVIVTAEDGTTTKTYQITVTREAISVNADLSGLQLSVGSLTPVFNASTNTYTATVDFLVTSLTVTPTVADTTASVTVGGTAVTSGTASSAISLSVGSNLVAVAVTAEDGTTVNTYNVTVTREPASTNANLDSLSFSSATLDQTFQATQPSYTATAHFLVPSITATAVVEDSTATFTINGVSVASGQSSGAINLPIGTSTVNVEVTAQDASVKTYTVSVVRGNASTFAQQVYAKSSNSEAGDRFGHSVAMSGDVLAIAAWEEDSATTTVNGDETDNAALLSGAVYIFERNLGDQGWTQQGYIKASNAQGEDRFGENLALSGDTLVVGAPDEDSSATGINGDATDNSRADSGAVYVFVRTAQNSWNQQAYIKGSSVQVNDKFGSSTALSGDTLVVGAREKDRVGAGGITDVGVVYVFVRDASNVWTQQAKLSPSNPDDSDLFGSSVTVSGDTLAIGAINEDGGTSGINGDQSDDTATNSGAVYVYTRDAGNNWTEQAYVKPSNTSTTQNFGTAVSLSGDTLAVGAPLEDSIGTGVAGTQAKDPADTTSTNDSGAVYIFTRDGSNVWRQQTYIKSSNSEQGDEFGTSVSLYNNTLAVGARDENGGATGINGDETDNSTPGSGAAYIFTRNTANNWTQDAYVKASNSGNSDAFGTSVAVNERNLVAGAVEEDSIAQGIGGNQGSEGAEQSGAAYFFE